MRLGHSVAREAGFSCGWGLWNAQKRALCSWGSDRRGSRPMSSTSLGCTLSPRSGLYPGSIPLVPGTEPLCLALLEAHPNFSSSQVVCYIHSRGPSSRPQTGDTAAVLLRAFMSLQGRAFLTLWCDFCFLPSPTETGWDSSRQWVGAFCHAWVRPQSKHHSLRFTFRHFASVCVTPVFLRKRTSFSLELPLPLPLGCCGPLSVCGPLSCQEGWSSQDPTYPETFSILPLLPALTHTLVCRMSSEGMLGSALLREGQRLGCQGGTSYVGHQDGNSWRGFARGVSASCCNCASSSDCYQWLGTQRLLPF